MVKATFLTWSVGGDGALRAAGAGAPAIFSLASSASRAA
jgi:hypothetical protein